VDAGATRGMSNQFSLARSTGVTQNCNSFLNPPLIKKLRKSIAEITSCTLMDINV